MYVLVYYTCMYMYVRKFPVHIKARNRFELEQEFTCVLYMYMYKHARKSPAHIIIHVCTS